MKQRCVLTEIRPPQTVTAAFLSLLEQGLLLALAERGLLTQTQVRAAEELRRKQKGGAL